MNAYITEKIAFNVNGQELKKALDGAKKATARNRDDLSKLEITVGNGFMKISSVDGYRASVYKLPIAQFEGDFTEEKKFLVIPFKLTGLLKMADVRITVENSSMTVTFLNKDREPISQVFPVYETSSTFNVLSDMMKEDGQRLIAYFDVKYLKELIESAALSEEEYVKLYQTGERESELSPLYVATEQNYRGVLFPVRVKEKW